MRRLALLTFALLAGSVGAADAVPSHLRVGVYTGSFDPPHVGHRNLVLRMKEKYGLDVVYVVPDKSTQYKPGISLYAHRAEMTRLLFDDVSDSVRVLPESLNREGLELWDFPEQVRKLHPEAEVFSLMGMDTYEWVRAQKLPERFSSVTLLVSERGSAQVLPEPGDAQKVFLEQVGDDGISSSSIRKAIEEGRDTGDLTASLLSYIRSFGLYLPKTRKCSVILRDVRPAFFSRSP